VIVGQSFCSQLQADNGQYKVAGLISEVAWSWLQPF